MSYFDICSSVTNYIVLFFKIGGIDEFHKDYPDFCDERFQKCPSYTSLSQPCLPLTNQGPTRILPFLYLGTQLDALNQEILKVTTGFNIFL